MTEEKVKKGQELLEKLEWLKEQKRKWEVGQEIKCLEICDRDGYGHINRVLSVSDDFINFEDLKLLALVRIDKRIKEVQEQFDNL